MGTINGLAFAGGPKIEMDEYVIHSMYCFRHDESSVESERNDDEDDNQQDDLNSFCSDQLIHAL